MTDAADALEDAIPLGEMIDTLRKELQDAMDKGKDQPLRFEMEKVELELQVCMTKSGNVEGGVAFWVLRVGGSKGSEAMISHTFKLTLLPVDAKGNRNPLTSR